MSNDSIGSLASQGEAARLQEDYDLAVDCFERLKSRLSEITATKQKAWVYAHLGATYSALAYTDEEDKRLYTSATEAFESALSLVADYKWAWAQFGEMWRNVANRYTAFPLLHEKLIRNLLEKPNVFNLDTAQVENSQTDIGTITKKLYSYAIQSFERAAPRSAWVHAHWGAALVNSRGIHCSTLSSSSVDDAYNSYTKAVDHLEQALQLKNHDYAWAWVYKFAAHTLLNVGLASGEFREQELNDRAKHAEQAYKSLFIAIVQDKDILDKIDVPLGDFGVKQPQMLLYAKAMMMYQRGAEPWGSADLRACYRSYFYALTRVYHDDLGEKSANLTSEIKAEVDDHLNKLDSDSTHAAHANYMRGGLLAVWGNPAQGLNCLAASLNQCTDSETRRKLQMQARHDTAWACLQGESLAYFQELIGATYKPPQALTIK